VRARITPLLLMVLLMGSLTLMPRTAEAQGGGGVDLPIQIPLPGGGTLEGVLEDAELVVRNGVLTLVGDFEGTLNIGGREIPVEIKNLRLPLRDILPVGPAQDPCTVLDLTVGPIDLRLLGLRIRTNEIHVLITANPAEGILGQILCALAGLDLGNLFDLLNNRELRQLLGILALLAEFGILEELSAEELAELLEFLFDLRPGSLLG